MSYKWFIEKAQTVIYRQLQEPPYSYRYQLSNGWMYTEEKCQMSLTGIGYMRPLKLDDILALKYYDVEFMKLALEDLANV